MYKFNTVIKVPTRNWKPLPELTEAEKRRNIRGPHTYIKSQDKTQSRI